jgi:hypothetical protein
VSDHVSAGWFADPSGAHRLRYWDGSTWTSWVADGEQPYVDALPEPGTPSGPSDHFLADREQRFWYEMLVIAPLFLAVWGLFAFAALTGGGTQIGVFLAIVWLVIAVLLLRQPYVAIVRPDGSLTFRALTRTINTTTSDVSRISITAGRGRMYVFHFGDRSASLGGFGGKRLTQFLVERNPGIQAP